MATAPFNLSTAASQRDVQTAWFAVAGAIVFVACTSTTLMSGHHTQMVVDYVWKSFFGEWHLKVTGPINLYGRKVGHFFGYGTIGLIFRQAWVASLRPRMFALRSYFALLCSALGVASTCALASLDEWHQMYLPQRHGSMYDALLDTLGAVFLAFAVWALRKLQRRQPVQQDEFVTLFCSHARRAWQ